MQGRILNNTTPPSLKGGRHEFPTDAPRIHRLLGLFRGSRQRSQFLGKPCRMCCRSGGLDQGWRKWESESTGAGVEERAGASIVVGVRVQEVRVAREAVVAEKEKNPILNSPEPISSTRFEQALGSSFPTTPGRCLQGYGREYFPWYVEPGQSGDPPLQRSGAWADLAQRSGGRRDCRRGLGRAPKRS